MHIKKLLEQNIRIRAPKMLFRDIILWIICFASVCSTFNIFITRNNPFIALIYFLCITGIIIFRYKKSFIDLTHKINKKQSFTLILLVCIHISTYFLTHKILGKPSGIGIEDNISFLEMNNYFLFAKPLEVILQQAFILALIFILQKHKMKMNTIITVLFLLFGGMHMFLIISMDIVFALYFTFFGLCASYLFTLIITKIRNGFIYSLALHMIFYEISALVFWSLL